MPFPFPFAVQGALLGGFRALGFEAFGCRPQGWREQATLKKTLGVALNPQPRTRILHPIPKILILKTQALSRNPDTPNRKSVDLNNNPLTRNLHNRSCFLIFLKVEGARPTVGLKNQGSMGWGIRPQYRALIRVAKNF